jgi:peptidoglycan hydrolase CwlO-like protein
METILAAALTGAISLAVCLITNHAQAEKTRALIDYRVSELEKKQDKHNNLMERTFRIEGHVQELQHEIMDLKKFHQP